MSIATQAFFWFPFAWNVFYHSFTFSWYVPLELKWVSCRQHIYGCNFCIHSTSLCLLVGAFVHLLLGYLVICIVCSYCHFFKCLNLFLWSFFLFIIQMNLTHLWLYNGHNNPISQDFHPTTQAHPPTPELSPPETIGFSISVSQHLFCKEVHWVLFSDSTCQWKHLMLVSRCLTDFT